MSFFKGRFGGRSYWFDITSASLLLLGGISYADAISEKGSNLTYYLALAFTVTAILIQYGIHRRLEIRIEEHDSQITVLNLKIKILELENKIRDLQENPKDN